MYSLSTGRMDEVGFEHSIRLSSNGYNKKSKEIYV